MLIFFLITGKLLTAQMQLQPVIAAYAGPSAYSVSHTDPFAVMYNPGAIARLKNRAMALNGGNNYGMKELKAFRFMGTFRTGHFSAGMAAVYEGSLLYHETGISGIVAHRLGMHLDLGVSFAFRSVQQSGYQSFVRPGAGFGILLYPIQDLTIGFCAENPFTGLLPSRYSWGIGYDASPLFFAGAEVIKEENMPARIQAAVEYVVKPVLFRAGLNSASFSFFMGAGYMIHSWQVLIMGSLHPQLGFSQGLTLQYGSLHERD